MVKAETWTAAARRALTRAERAETVGNFAEAEAQLDRANRFFTQAKEAAK
jgi:hypothetical protein